jgi:hypothetical protein
MGFGWGALLTGLGIIFLVGFIVPLLVSPFVSVGEYNHDSFIAPIISFVGGSENMSASTSQGFISTQLNAFSYIPDVVAIPLLILSLVLIIYSFIPLV